MPCVLVDTNQNILRLVLREPAASVETRAVPAILDVGEGGRLLGIELDITLSGSAMPPIASEHTAAAANPESGPLYIPLASTVEEGSTGHVRSAEATAQLLTDADGVLCEVRVPRRGVGYEITYPSGNR